MGKPTGFMEYPRRLPPDKTPELRVLDWKEFHEHMPRTEPAEAGRPLHGLRRARSAIPTKTGGCPINNLIPEWNDLVYHGHWHEAIDPPVEDQQLPGVHRPGLPGAVRRLVRPGH